MSKQISTERVYLKSIDDCIRRYEDEYGVYWYVYDEICDKLLITHRARKDIFNNWLEDQNKAEFYDTNDCDRRNLYINTDALSKMINRNHERANMILKDIINNETRNLDFSLTDLDVEFNKLKTKLNQPVTNYVDICLEMNAITKMDEFRDTMDKYSNEYDLNIEEALDKIRDYMYKDEIKWILAETTDDEEIKLFKDGDEWNFENWLK